MVYSETVNRAVICVFVVPHEYLSDAAGTAYVIYRGGCELCRSICYDEHGKLRLCILQPVPWMCIKILSHACRNRAVIKSSFMHDFTQPREHVFEFLFVCHNMSNASWIARCAFRYVIRSSTVLNSCISFVKGVKTLRDLQIKLDAQRAIELALKI